MPKPNKIRYHHEQKTKDIVDAVRACLDMEPLYGNKSKQLSYDIYPDVGAWGVQEPDNLMGGGRAMPRKKR
jgi:hypothetical protein